MVPSTQNALPLHINTAYTLFKSSLQLSHEVFPKYLKIYPLPSYSPLSFISALFLFLVLSFIHLYLPAFPHYDMSYRRHIFCSHNFVPRTCLIHSTYSIRKNSWMHLSRALTDTSILWIHPILISHSPYFPLIYIYWSFN